MSKITEFCNALNELGDGRYHYWNGQSGIGCSDYVRMALGLAGIITPAEANDSTSLWAAQCYRRVLKDTTRFKELPSSTSLQKGDIMWFHGKHVSVYAGGNYDVWEAAPEQSHGICSNGKTGVGLWKNHNYNCAGGTLTCLYRIKEYTLSDNDIIEKYMSKAEALANDNTHGYNNSVGHNLGPDFGHTDMDCGAFVSTCLRYAGLIGASTIIEPNSPTGTWGYDTILTAAGFTKLPFRYVDVKRGDVLIRDGKHTELAYGANYQIGAHNDYDGKVGDSSGNEISKVGLGLNWDYMYRLNVTEEPIKEQTTEEGAFDMAKLSVLKKGKTGAEVKSMQSLLNGKYNAGLAVDGSFGPATDKALRAYQSAKGLEVDGYCGPNTWQSLLQY